MTGKKWFAIIALAAFVTVLSAACSAQVNGNPGILTEDQAGQLAEQYVKESPTFAFDAVDESLELAETLYPDIENAWTFVFKFRSLHSGYGNRDGEMVLQVVTPHEMTVTVEQGKITAALIDSQWDSINQRMLDG